MSEMLRPILGQLLRHPRRTAVIDDRRRWPGIDLLGGAFHVARALDRAGASKHVAVMLPTSGAFPMAMLGTWLSGRTLVPINYLLSADERQRLIDHSDANVLLTAGIMLDYLGDAPSGVKVLKLDEMRFGGVPPLRWPPRPAADDVAAILYTSGTSGAAKGVMLTHGNLRSNVEATVELAKLDRSDGFLGVLPQFHSFGLTALTLIPIRVGVPVIYTARFVPAKLVKLIRDHRPDIFMAIPSMYHALLGVKRAGREDFESIRLAVSGAEPLPESVREGFRQRFGVTILEGYGLTETGPIVSWSLPERHMPGAVGTVLPGIDVRIVDGGNRPLQTGEHGEIIVRGPSVMAGYYKAPDLTERVFDSDGFFHTGDRGKLDEEGRLWVTGRIKEMMIIAGENVFPNEIEEVIAAHPSVHSAGVVGRVDPSRGEVPVAFVQLAEGETFDEPALRQWCRDRLAGFKVPRQIQPVDELPRSATGKILRRKLSEMSGPDGNSADP